MHGETRMARRDGTVDPETVVDLSRRTGMLLRHLGDVRRRDGLGAEDLLIYLAVGHLGVDGAGAIPRLTPRTYLEIGGFLGIPRETVRRKVGRLSDRGLVQIGPGGVVIRDVAEWLRHVEALFSPALRDDRTRPSSRLRPEGT